MWVLNQNMNSTAFVGFKTKLSKSLFVRWVYNLNFELADSEPPKKTEPMVKYMSIEFRLAKNYLWTKFNYEIKNSTTYTYVQNSNFHVQYFGTEWHTNSVRNWKPSKLNIG